MRYSILKSPAQRQGLLRRRNAPFDLGERKAIVALKKGKAELQWCALVCMAGAVAGHAAVTTTGQNLSVTIQPMAKISVATPNVTLAAGSGVFASYTASAVVLQYKVRTTTFGTSSGVTLRVTSDFSPASPVTGPSAARNELTYTCSNATVPTGTACSGPITAGSGSSNVLTFAAKVCSGLGNSGGNNCSASFPNQISVNFTLLNNPQTAVGGYTATITYTVSAT